MFDWVLNMSLLRVKNKKTDYLIEKTLNFTAPFYGVFIAFLKATEPLRGDGLLFTIQSPGVPGNYLINFDWMKA